MFRVNFGLNWSNIYKENQKSVFKMFLLKIKLNKLACEFSFYQNVAFLNKKILSQKKL